jgi:uncharacterized protein (TIGR00251 family)
MSERDLMHAWLQETAGSCAVRIKVQPGAKRTRVIGAYGDLLKVAIAAPPVDGRANTLLLRWLSETLGVASSSVTLISGQTSRLKRVAITGIASVEIGAILLGIDSGEGA